MTNSMTGYGDAEGQLEGITYAVEIKTVNNRYFKATIKLPESVAFLEEDIDRVLRKELLRGTANYMLRLKNISTNDLFDIDETTLRVYMEKLGKIVSSVDIKCPIDIGGLLELPGVLVPVSPDKDKAERIRGKVLSITQEAIDKLKQMRAAEGAALAADLDSNCKAIKQALEKIRGCSVGVLQEYAERLKKRVDRLLADAKLKLDEETLAREVAIFTDKSDISEEIARLDSHLQQFAESCHGTQANTSEQSNTQVGRRLEFIGQEMLREANTMASKACNAEIAQLVVDIKSRIDRIKEQVQNVE